MSLFESVEEFVAVGQYGNFSSAAKALNVSVAHVSRKISQLEEKLGVKLLSRSTRVVKLTDNGMDYLRQCQSIIEAMQESNDNIKAHDQELEGRITISAVGVLAETTIAKIITQFCLKHPRVTVNIDYSSKNINLFEENIDFAIRYGFQQDANHIGKLLISRDLEFAASKEYLQNNGMPAHPSELNEHRCLTSNGKPWRYVEDGQIKTVRVNNVWQSNSTHALLNSAMLGNGILYLPQSSVKSHIERGLLIPILQLFAVKHMPTYLVYPQRGYIPKRVRLLMDDIVAKVEAEASE